MKRTGTVVKVELEFHKPDDELPSEGAYVLAVSRHGSVAFLSYREEHFYVQVGGREVVAVPPVLWTYPDSLGKLVNGE